MKTLLGCLGLTVLFAACLIALAYTHGHIGFHDGSSDE